MGCKKRSRNRTRVDRSLSKAPLAVLVMCFACESSSNGSASSGNGGANSTSSSGGSSSSSANGGASNGSGETSTRRSDGSSGDGGSAGNSMGTLGGAAGSAGSEPVESSICPGREEIAPLDPGCSEEVCHVIVRLAADQLRFLGYAVRGGAAAGVDDAEAGEIALGFLGENSEILAEELGAGNTNLDVRGPVAGLYTAYASPVDFGGFALIGEDSGLVVAAGEVVWSGSGDPLAPLEWQGAAELECGTEPVEPAESEFDQTHACTVASADDALDMVLRSNLAMHVAEQGEFSAFTFLYTPSVGGCDPELAEYLVVLTQTVQ